MFAVTALKFRKTGPEYASVAEYDTYTIRKTGSGWTVNVRSHSNGLVWDDETFRTLTDAQEWASEHAHERALDMKVKAKHDRWLAERDTTGETWVEFLRRLNGKA